MIKKKNRVKWLVSILFFMLTGCANTQEQEITWNTEVVDEVSMEFSQNVQDETQQAEIYVHVCGAIANPGVYEMSADSRVYEVIALAGGMLPEADETYLNLADKLQDGSKIQVYTKEEVQEKKSDVLQKNEKTEAGKININTASARELTQLTGIGDSRAEAIISYRDTQGSFQSIEQIKQVDGIKDGLFQKIKDKITVD